MKVEKKINNSKNTFPNFIIIIFIIIIIIIIVLFIITFIVIIDSMQAFQKGSLREKC